jgi:hypothetical protein
VNFVNTAVKLFLTREREALIVLLSVVGTGRDFHSEFINIFLGFHSQFIKRDGHRNLGNTTATGHGENKGVSRCWEEGGECPSAIDQCARIVLPKLLAAVAVWVRAPYLPDNFFLDPVVYLSFFVCFEGASRKVSRVVA